MCQPIIIDKFIGKSATGQDVRQFQGRGDIPPLHRFIQLLDRLNTIGDDNIKPGRFFLNPEQRHSRFAPAEMLPSVHLQIRYIQLRYRNSLQQSKSDFRILYLLTRHEHTHLDDSVTESMNLHIDR